MAKMNVNFQGFQQVLSRLKNLEGDVKATTERALKETHAIVTEKADEAIRRHKYTGDTEKSLRRQAEINWQGTKASVSVGFDIANGGLPSIFLMYGTPRVRKDTQLYNAFYGKAIRDEVMQLQEETFYNAIRKLGG